MSQKVRVRFAPSPTGPLHIGGVRTALFNYLFAKKHGGDFILRIEDTDQTRYVEGAENYIVEAMNWLNIPFDESPLKDGGFGPYRQSERKDIYLEYVDKLIASGDAYYAFDSAEALNEHRANHEAEGKTFIYNWHNRLKLTNSLALSEAETKAKIDAGEPYVVRFKCPQDETLSMVDVIRGDISIDTNVLDDKVLFKSDGMPTYHLANIVDDHLMQITHVIRGEEWLPSMALHILLYQAFGWEAPEFAHLPLILKPVGNGKLSKRDGDKFGFPVFPLNWDNGNEDVFPGYRESGYIPEAVVNMLAFLGWNPGTEQELFKMDQLIKDFDLTRVNKSGAKFDFEKTKWFQQQYLQEVDDETLAIQFLKLLKDKGISTNINVTPIVTSLKERATFVSDIWDEGSFFFERPVRYDEKAAGKAFKEGTAEILSSVKEILTGLDNFENSHVSEAVKGWITSQEMGFGKVMMPLRLALVGEMKGPDVFEIASLLGKEETVARIDNAVTYMN